MSRGETRVGPTTREERNAEILRRWRDGETWATIADAFGMTTADVHAVVNVLVEPDEIEDRRGRMISRSQQRFSDEDLLLMLQACAEELGRTPGSAVFDRWTKNFWAQLLLMRFGSWRRACELAGLRPHERPPGMGERTYSDEDALLAYRRIKEKVAPGRVTVQAWMACREPGEPGEGTLRRRHGGWRAFVREMEAALVHSENGRSFQ